MEEYSNEKTIEKLDPIPGGWNHDAKSKFLDHGFLAIAGETPAAVMRTKRIDLDTLMSNLPGVIVWLGNSQTRSSDGVFLLNESKSSETHREDKNLVCSDGILRAVHGGWYHIQATWIMNGGGANNEYRHAILSLSVADSPRSEMQATMDLSVSGNNYCTITAVVYVDDEDSSIKFTISGLSNDALVTSRLDNISVHKLAAVTSAANIHAEGELDQKQSDWNETDPNKVEYIKNKPDLSVYATTDYVDTTKDDILAALGKPLQWKGPSTVAQLNSGITGIQEGWTYTLTDAGTLTDGSIAVEKDDEVAWTGTTWFKLGDGRIYNITSTDGTITAMSDIDPATGVTSFDLSLTNPPDATLTVRHETNNYGTYDTLGTFTATGPDKTITVPKEAFSFRIGNRSCFYNDVVTAYLTDRPVFAYEIYTWYDQGLQKEDIYQYMAMKQYTGDSNVYDGTANIQFVRVDTENNKIVMAKCLPEYPGSVTGYAKWEKTELPLDGGAGVYYVEYGTTTFADAEAAYLAGKTLVCREIGQTIQQSRMDDLYFLIDYHATGTYTGYMVFSNITGDIQTNVVLSPSATYTKTMTTLATHQEVIGTLASEIAPDYGAVVQKGYDEDSFPIPAGTYVTYPDNTSSSVLQYLYKSKVAIERWEEATSDPHTAPQKWDKILVADELGKGVAYVDIAQTPFADVLSLYNQGKYIVGRNGYEFYRLIGYNESWGSITGFIFQNISGPVIYTWRVTSDGPAETNNWVTPPDIYINAWIGTSATPYDETRTYSEGDVVSHYSDLYKCNTDIDVAESWTDAHWTRTTVAEELNKLKGVNPLQQYSFDDNSFPSGNDVWNNVSSGNVVFLRRQETEFNTTRIYVLDSFSSLGNLKDVHFMNQRINGRLDLHTDDGGETWSWTET